LKSEEYRIIQDLNDNLGVIDDEQYAYLQKLQQNIEQKTQSYMAVVSKGGILDSEIQRIEEAIEQAESYKRKVQERKRFMENILNQLAQQSKEGFLTYNTGAGTEIYMKPYFYKKTSIDINKVEDEYGSYVLPKLTNNEFKSLVAQLSDKELQARIVGGVKHEVTVTQLPDDHSSIQTELTPSVKFVKTRPK
jgi:hypothetical protein